MDRCPVCQARLRQEPTCPRCRTDLSRLAAIEDQATHKLRLAIAALAVGDEAQALAETEACLRLKQGTVASSLRRFLAQRLNPSPAA